MCKGSFKRDWTYVFILTSLSAKTRRSNHLQMLGQRQHLLLNSLKALSVGPAGNRTQASSMGRLAPYQLGYNQAVSRKFFHFWQTMRTASGLCEQSMCEEAIVEINKCDHPMLKHTFHRNLQTKEFVLFERI